MAPPADVAVPGVLEPALIAPSPAGGRWARLRSGLALWVPLGMVIFILLLCFVWPLIGSVPSPTGGYILNSNLPSFSPGHLFGTDSDGNDEWSRLLYGGRASLEVAFAVNAFGLLVGGGLGMWAGYTRGWLDSLIMRVMDVFIAFPALVLAVAIAERLGPSQFHVIIALVFFSVPAVARVARASTLRIREENYMVAAELSGTGRLRTLVRHIAPNVIPELATFSFLGIGITIVLEGALSFLGLGIQAPNPSWGNMIASGEGVLSAQPKFTMLPSAALFITVIAFNLVGEALRNRWSRR